MRRSTVTPLRTVAVRASAIEELTPLLRLLRVWATGSSQPPGSAGSELAAEALVLGGT